MFVLGSTILSPDRPFTANGIQYPANWLRLSTLEEKQAIGIRELPDPPTWDQRFYWGYDEDGQLIPKDHAQLVQQWTQQTRHTANTLLTPTDWVVIREVDNGATIDPPLRGWREDIRLAAGVKVEAIEATADTTELAAYITGSDYPVWPTQGEPTMEAPEVAS
jgi:hypothetical protein